MSRQGNRHVAHRRAIGLGCAAAIAVPALVAFAGCGESSSDSQAVEARIDRERHDAAAIARQEQRLKDLAADYARLRRAERHARAVVRTTQAAVPQTGDAPAPDTGRIFHAPSGNVSCLVDVDSAACSVASIDATFVLPSGGGSGFVEHGTTLVRDSGALAGWGTSVSVGSVTCRIPPEDEPSGITCTDASSGHGFEASRVDARQKVY